MLDLKQSRSNAGAFRCKVCWFIIHCNYVSDCRILLALNSSLVGQKRVQDSPQWTLKQAEITRVCPKDRKELCVLQQGFFQGLVLGMLGNWWELVHWCEYRAFAVCPLSRFSAHQSHNTWIMPLLLVGRQKLEEIGCANFKVWRRGRAWLTWVFMMMRA